MAEIKDIVIIGAGNVGTHLAVALQKAGCSIRQVVGRREKAVVELARETNAPHTFDFSNILSGQDLYLMALPDGVMEEVLPKLKLDNGLLVHTSGSVPMNILSPYSENTGVFYPLQTFTRKRELNLRDVPFLVEANRIDNENKLHELASLLSERAIVADSDRRQKMHIAAVFASNFSNHMYNMARILMEDNGLDFAMLEPLIRETTAKAMELGPGKAQTGPALRKDMQVIQKHIEMLSDKPEVRELYRMITQNIIDQNT